jgi:hypothetical protein
MKSMRILEPIIHEVRCAAYAHYEDLKMRLEDTNDERNTSNLVHVEVCKAQDTAVINGFDQLVENFFPGAASSTEELPKV